jgi:hypothetical protein
MCQIIQQNHPFIKILCLPVENVMRLADGHTILRLVLGRLKARRSRTEDQPTLKEEELMKKRMPILLLGALALLSPLSLYAQQQIPPRCHFLGVEVYTFYGDRATVMKGLEKIPAGLARMTTILVETGDSAEFHLYEKVGSNIVNVYSWKGASVGNLKEDLSNVMLATRGVACGGEETKKMLGKRFALQQASTPAPASASAAFAGIANSYGSGYLRVTVMAHCGAGSAS